MNKKLLLGAALLIGMGPVFTSCVDSTESASVTAVREAKAEQLKSIAELNKANAEAALILANAEKAAQAASEAYQQAQAAQLAAEAEYLKAQAALLQAQAEVEQAKAAAMNAQTAADQQRLQAELQEKELQRKLLQAELDKKAQDLEDQKAAALAAQKLLEKGLAMLEQKIEEQRIQNLLNEQEWKDKVYAANKQEKDDYNTEYNKLYSALKSAQDYVIECSYQLNRAKAAYLWVDAQLISLKASYTAELQNLLNNKSEFELKIAEYQKVIDVLGQYAGQTVTPQMVKDAMLAYENASAAKETALEDKNEKNQALTDAREQMNNSNFVNDLSNLFDISESYSVYDEMGSRIETTFVIRYVYENTSTPDCYNQYALVIEKRLYASVGSDWDPISTTYVPVCESENFGLSSEQKQYEDQDYSYWYREYNTNFNLIDDGAGLHAWVEQKENQAKAYADQYYNVEDAQKELDKATAILKGGKYTDDNGAEIEVKVGAEKAYETASAAYVKAKQAYEEANAKLYGGTYTDANGKEVVVKPEDAAVKYAASEVEAEQKIYNDALLAYQKANLTLNGIPYNDAEGKEVSLPEGTLSAEAANIQTYTELNKAISDYNSALNGYNSAVNNSQYFANEVESAKETVKNIIAQASENDSNIVAYNEASYAYAKAYVDYQIAQKAESDAYNEYSTLSQYLYSNLENDQWDGVDQTYGDNTLISSANSAVDYANHWINEYKQDLAECEDRIATVKANIALVEEGVNPNDYDTYYDQRKAELQAEIDKWQEKYNIAVQRCKIAQDEFEAFVKSEEPAE